MNAPSIRLPVRTNTGTPGTINPLGPQKTTPQGVKIMDPTLPGRDPASTYSDFKQSRCEVGTVVPVVYGLMPVHPNITSVLNLNDYGINVEKNTFGGSLNNIGIEGDIELTFCVGKCSIKSLFRSQLLQTIWEGALPTAFATYLNAGENPATNVMRESLSLPGVVRIRALQTHASGLFTSYFHSLFFGTKSFNYVESGKGLPDIFFLLLRDLSHTAIDYYEISHVPGDGYDAQPPPENCFGANPAAVIYDILTDAQYGLGISDELINKTSFNAVAKSMFDLKYGLNFVMDTASPANVYIDKVCATVGIALYIDKDGIINLRHCTPLDGANPVVTIDEEHIKEINIEYSTFRDTFNDLSALFQDTRYNRNIRENINVVNEGNIAVTK